MPAHSGSVISIYKINVDSSSLSLTPHVYTQTSITPTLIFPWKHINKTLQALKPHFSFFVISPNIILLFLQFLSLSVIHSEVTCSVIHLLRKYSWSIEYLTLPPPKSSSVPLYYIVWHMKSLDNYRNFKRLHFMRVLWCAVCAYFHIRQWFKIVSCWKKEKNLFEVTWPCGPVCTYMRWRRTKIKIRTNIWKWENKIKAEVVS